MMIIFDLDQTMVNSIAVKKWRDNRDWYNVHNHLHLVTPYEGISDLLKYMNDRDLPISIVTSSPMSYCEKIIRIHQWKIQTVVCYHDTKMHKPHPAPIIKAIKNIKTNLYKVISIGDEPNDIIASKAARVFSVAATWGAENKDKLYESNPDHFCHSVSEFEEFSKSFYGFKH